MKRRFVWRYRVGGGYGNCPKWYNAESVSGTEKWRERVLAIGNKVPCNYCTENHVPVAAPSNKP